VAAPAANPHLNGPFAVELPPKAQSPFPEAVEVSPACPGLLIALESACVIATLLQAYSPGNEYGDSPLQTFSN